MALGDHNTYYAISPLIGVLPRYYDDRKRRAKMGKNTYGNSANFLAVDCVYYFDPVWKGYREGRSKSYVFFPYWRLRRVYKKRMLLELNWGGNIGRFLNGESISREKLLLSLGWCLG